MADVTHAQALIEGIKADAVLADKAYDANHVLEYLAQRNIQAVIPPNPHISRSFPKLAKTGVSRKDSGFTDAGEDRLDTG